MIATMLDFRALIAMCLAVTSLLGGAGCAAETDTREEGAEHLGTASAAITSGEDDDGDAAVVAILDKNGDVHCTGFLVSSNVVVTAAHCVTPTLPDAVFFGARPGPGKRGTTIKVKNALAHPDYDEDSLDNDVGVLALAAEAPAKPLVVRAAPFDASFKGKPLRIVGFGATGTAEGGKRKRVGSSIVQSYGVGTFRLKGTPSQTCLGDSGGPAFAPAASGGGESVIGIASAGDSDCKEYATHTRIDVHFDFIRDYAKRYAPASTREDESAGCSTAPARRSSSGAAALLLACVALGLCARKRARA